jgi:hypothetical protein
MLGSALAHTRRSRIVLDSRDAVLEAHGLAARRHMREPVVVVAESTSEVGRQIVATTRREPAILVMPEAELLLSFVQSRREFFHRLTALLADARHAEGQIRVLVCAEGGVELSLWTEELAPLQR